MVEIVTVTESTLRRRINMLFAGWEVRTVKNCDLGLENTARGRIFPHTDRPLAGK